LSFQVDKALKEGLKETIDKANNGNTDAIKGAEYMFNTVSNSDLHSSTCLTLYVTTGYPQVHV